VSGFVSPVVDFPVLEMRMHFIQHKMFPQDSIVIIPEFLPSLMVAVKPCTKKYTLGAEIISEVFLELKGLIIFRSFQASSIFLIQNSRFIM
jgi:hypothetical protein